MKREDIVNLTEKVLKSISDTKKRISLIDIDLEKDICDIDTIDKLKNEKVKLQRKLSRVIKAIGTLEDSSQRIICYKYFDNLPNTKIAPMVGLSLKTIERRSKTLLLDIGRVIFGLEDEFWNEIYFE
jgi:DNA-directed RNA polymerase specialized sigma subunit